VKIQIETDSGMTHPERIGRTDETERIGSGMILRRGIGVVVVTGIRTKTGVAVTELRGILIETAEIVTEIELTGKDVALAQRIRRIVAMRKVGMKKGNAPGLVRRKSIDPSLEIGSVKGTRTEMENGVIVTVIVTEASVKEKIASSLKKILRWEKSVSRKSQ
jgi:hypothetical protein